MELNEAIEEYKEIKTAAEIIATEDMPVDDREKICSASSKVLKAIHELLDEAHELTIEEIINRRNARRTKRNKRRKRAKTINTKSLKTLALKWMALETNLSTLTKSETIYGLTEIRELSLKCRPH